MDSSNINKKFMTVNQWVKAFGFYPVAGIRFLIHSNKSFQDKVIIRIGRKILIDVEAMDQWVRSHKKSD